LKGTSCIRLKAGAKLEDYHDGAFGSTAGRANMMFCMAIRTREIYRTPNGSNDAERRPSGKCRTEEGHAE